MKLTINGNKPQIFNGEHYIIGRGSGCDISLPRDDNSISRKHALIERHSDGHWYVSDMQSRNGTSINGKLIDGVLRLRDGDTLTIGDSNLIVQDIGTVGDSDEPETATYFPSEDARGRQRSPDSDPVLPLPPHRRTAPNHMPAADPVPPTAATGPLHAVQAARNPPLIAIGIAMVLLALFAYLVGIKPVIDEYDKPVGQAARAVGPVADALKNMVPAQITPAQKLLDAASEEGATHTRRYDLALTMRQVCIAVALIGVFLVFYGLVANSRR